MEKIDASIEVLGVFRCPNCGVEDTGLTPVDTAAFEQASETTGELLCVECESIMQPPQDPDGHQPPSAATALIEYRRRWTRG